MGPAVFEQGTFAGQAIEVRRRGSRVAVGAQVIRAQGIDGDEKDLQIARHRVWNRLERRRTQGRGGGVLAVAVLIDAVVGPIARAGIAFRIAVVAVAAAEEARIAVVVEIGQTLSESKQLAGQAGARRGRLARRFVFRGRENRDQGERGQADRQRESPLPSEGARAKKQREGGGRRDGASNHRHQGPGQELKVLRPARSN